MPLLGESGFLPGRLAQEGAEYLVRLVYQVVESYSRFTDEGQKAALRGLVAEHLEPRVHTEESYIADLAPLGHSSSTQ